MEQGREQKNIDSRNIFMTTAALCVMAVIFVGIGYKVRDRLTSPSSAALEVISQSEQSLGAIYIPTVKELQEALCQARYTVEVDCVVGRETIKAWNAYCADREAMKYFTPSGIPKK